MQNVLIDSNYLIDFLRGKTYTKEIIEKVKRHEINAMISVITLFELFIGAKLSNRREGLEEVELLVQYFKIISLSENIALIASNIFIDLKKDGKIIDIKDIFIAATAICENAFLLTENKEHFKNIRGLKLLV